MKMADRAMKNVFYGVNFSIILGTVHSTTTRQASFSHTHKENRLDRRCVHYTQIAAAQQEKIGQKVSKVVFDYLIYIPIISLKIEYLIDTPTAHNFMVNV
jgi:hypothetical protein